MDQLKVSVNFRINHPALMQYRQKTSDSLDDFVIFVHTQALLWNFTDTKLQERIIEPESKKLTIQIAITTANRASEIQNLNSKHMTGTGPTIIFHPDKPTQVTRQGQALTKLEVHSLTRYEQFDATLCVRSYIHTTRLWRTDKINWLFLSTV